MADTDIEWTDKVWNVTRGCSRRSPGCGGGTPGPLKGGCYAERMAIRMSGPGQAYEGLVESTPSGPRWTGKMRLVWDKLLEPLSWRKHQRVFVNSMSDLFHEALTDDDIDHVFATMLACQVLEGVPRHAFQVLTKRAERMAAYFAAGQDALLTRWGKAGDGRIIMDNADIYFSEYVEGQRENTAPNNVPWPLPNVWLGVSVEGRRFLSRLDSLRRAPAAVRFVSFEPLLEDIGPANLSGISWAIVGGESGPGARPFAVDWARSLVNQCREQGTLPFVKQMGSIWAAETGAMKPLDKPVLDARLPGGELHVTQARDTKGGHMPNWPEDIRVREIPASVAGVPLAKTTPNGSTGDAT